MNRGKLIQAPCGSGKSRWIREMEPSTYLDGDVILEKAGIKNRNIYWYSGVYAKEREAIWQELDKWLNMGYSILYSGNPNLLPTDLLVIPETEQRWNWLQQRKLEGGWAPSSEQFMKEEKAYRMASKNIPTIGGFDLLN